MLIYAAEVALSVAAHEEKRAHPELDAAEEPSAVLFWSDFWFWDLPVEKVGHFPL
jgi:hypothetical protein